jgi:hypothetical protein
MAMNGDPVRVFARASEATRVRPRCSSLVEVPSAKLAHDTSPMIGSLVIRQRCRSKARISLRPVGVGLQSSSVVQPVAYLDRIIVLNTDPAQSATSYLSEMFASAGRAVPPVLGEWEERVEEWCTAYRGPLASSRLVEVKLEQSVYVFDLDAQAERVLLAYGIAQAQDKKRDAGRIRGFPNVNVGVRAVMGDQAFPADRGHFLGHASGGVLDINLFPQRRELNRGWSSEGRAFRAMERHVAANPGVFFYHRATYDDSTWIPYALEYGVLVDDGRWWVQNFRNK